LSILIVKPYHIFVVNPVTVNKSLITNDVMTKIIRFIEINMNVIIAHSNYEITSDEMIDKLKKVE
jgi:hypothetical protein